MKSRTRLTPTVQKRKCTSVNLMEEGEKKKKMKMNMGSSTCKLKFVGWRMKHHKDWESWATNMCFVHKSTWENAGIYEAVMNSTYIIKRQDDLILELASRWCSQTNTFVFPWGEVALTLEDMSVLGGFSSSGASALSSIENDPESLNIKEQLELARKEIASTRAKTPLLSKWIEKFKDSSDEVAHAAFLSLWLSRYVFPAKSVKSGIINKHVFPVAAQLSRGIELALGPAVLAMLYSDLSALSKRLRFNQLVDHSDDKVWQTNLCGLFHLVQIWAWERFPILQPVLEYMPVVPSFPRLARWSNVEILKGKDLKAALDSGEEAFLWRPYGSSSSSGQCMETVELVGFDSCIEKYQPRRVARQFGLDQGMGTEDVVGSVPPGFASRAEAILIIDSDSDSDDDHDVQMTPQAQIKREDCDEDDIDELELLQRSNLVCPDEEVEHMFFMDKTEASQTEASERASVQEDHEEDGITNKDDFAPLQRSNLASTPSENESSEAMHVANGHVHETEEEEGDELQGMEADDEPATSYEAENDMNEWLQDSGLDLEARISRLENIVYPAIKELEEAMQVRHH